MSLADTAKKLIKKNGRVYIDPDGEKLAGGKIKAMKMKSTEAHHKYG